MLYRNFQTTGDKVSLLGLGAMRFPLTDDGKVDEAETIRMIHHAIDSGVNYVDTAYTYHGGTSEVIVAPHPSVRPISSQIVRIYVPLEHVTSNSISPASISILVISLLRIVISLALISNSLPSLARS